MKVKNLVPSKGGGAAYICHHPPQFCPQIPCFCARVGVFLFLSRFSVSKLPMGTKREPDALRRLCPLKTAACGILGPENSEAETALSEVERVNNGGRV